MKKCKQCQGTGKIAVSVEVFGTPEVFDTVIPCVSCQPRERQKVLKDLQNRCAAGWLR